MEENEKTLIPVSSDEMMLDTARFDHLWRVACLFAKSDMVPKHYRNKNENCMITISMAFRMHIDPFMMLQNSYVIHGRPGVMAQLAIALVNKSGTFKAPIQYKYSGEGKTRSCTAYAVSKSGGQTCEQTVSMTMANAEGWTKDKKNKETGAIIRSKWNTLPDLMLAYRAAVFLARLYCPEALMGMQTVEEIEDVGVIDITPNKVENLKDKLKNGNTTEPAADLEPSVKKYHDLLNQMNDDMKLKFASLNAPAIGDIGLEDRVDLLAEMERIIFESSELPPTEKDPDF